MKKYILCAFGIVVMPFVLSAQNITNEGTDFWLAFPECHDLTTATYQVNISAQTAASGTVEIPGTGFSQNFTITPGQISRVVLPAADAVITQSEILLSRAIHVFSNAPVVVYANTYHQYRSEASLVLPNIALGDEYLITSYPSQVNTTLKQSEFIIVAAGDSVTVEITTTTNTEATRQHTMDRYARYGRHLPGAGAKYRGRPDR